jgi:hypothetical protein
LSPGHGVAHIAERECRVIPMYSLLLAEAIANLDEAMVLKMVLEEQIAKHNANLN